MKALVAPLAMSLLALGALAGAAEAGGSGGLTALEGAWERRAGDERERVARPGAEAEVRGGITEYALGMPAPPEARSGDWAVAVGPMAAAWELRAGGQLVGAHGDVDAGRDGAAEARVLPLSGATFDGAGPLSFELRVWRPGTLVRDHEGAALDTAEMVLAPRGDAERWARVKMDDQIFERAVAPFVLAVVLLILGLYHVRLHRGRREQLGYLWFGLLCLSVGAWNLVWAAFWAGLTRPLGYEVVLRLGVAFALASVPLGMEFVAQLSLRARPSALWRGWQVAVVGLAVACFLPGGVGTTAAGSAVPDLAVLGGAALAMVAIVRATVDGDPDARSILLGVAVLLVALVLNYAGLRRLDLGIVEVPVPSLGFLALVLSMAVALADRFARTLRDLDQRNAELERTHEAASRFVPFQFLQQLGKARITDVDLGDQVEREMTVLFSDIRSFTDLSERMTPQENFDFINRYLRAMEPAVDAGGGFIDKYIGDAVMALFAPGPGDPFGAEGAVRAAVGMMERLRELNRELAAEGLPPLSIGVGVHTGRLMLGTIGGRSRMDGTVISDAVNTASRVEGMTKHYGCDVLVTGATRAALPEPDRFQLREVDRVIVKGRTEPVTVHEVFDADSAPVRERKQRAGATIHRARELAGSGDVRGALEQLSAADGDDPVLALHRSRLEAWLAEGDPDAPWDGVSRMTTK